MLGLVTTVAGRHDHLLGQLRGIEAATRKPDIHVVVAMGDPDISEVVGGSDVTVVDVPCIDGRLPVAAARNAGAACALAAGVDAIVFLDVDCIPAPALFSSYEAAILHQTKALLSGSVGYLPPAALTGYDFDRLAALAHEHPARRMIATASGSTARLDHDLFWSLSFALSEETWSAIGGFCSLYTGYGGEDTDFAQLARVSGIDHFAVADAVAYHQWHPTPDPPLQHLNDIVRNARTFRQRWGRWPMSGWLEAFRELGLMTYDPDADDWVLADQQPG